MPFLFKVCLTSILQKAFNDKYYFHNRSYLAPGFNGGSHIEPDKANITDLNSINQHIYNKLLVRCFVFHVLQKSCSVFIFWRIFPFFSDEVAVLRTSKDKLENFWAKFAVIRRWVPMITI